MVIHVGLLLCIFNKDFLFSAHFIKKDVRQKANLSEFVEFKMAHQAAETTYNTLDPGTHKHTVNI